MKLHVARIFERLRSSYWFIPGLMALGAAGLAMAAEMADRRFDTGTMAALGRIYGGGPEGAREVLSTTAGSMITVAGVVFSITMVALVLASSQFGPRILRNFMRDRANQVVLGTFIATFLYCLLVLRAVRGFEDVTFVPHLSVALGVGLALASVGVLIFFIHHVATSIQAPVVVARVGRELDEAVDRVYPDDDSDDDRAEEDSPSDSESRGRNRRGDPGVDAGPAHDGRSIHAPRGGYVTALDHQRLLTVATEKDLTVRCLCRPGDHLVEGEPLASVSSAGELDEKAADRIRSAFHLASTRSEQQDVIFAAGELVEIAVRSLSTGINDPFTATNCVDRLAQALARVARRSPPAERLRDDEGRVRVVLIHPSFGDLLDVSFEQIRAHGRGSAFVLVSLLEAIESVGCIARRPSDRAELIRHADRVAEVGREGVEDRPGRERVQGLHSAVRARLEGPAPDG